MSAHVLTRPGIPSNALELLERARAGLETAALTAEPGPRYVAGHLAALRAAAAVLAVRGRPRRTGGAVSVWHVLPRVAPELSEWAAFFAAGAARRSAIDAGRADVVRTREADDLVRDAGAFVDVVSEVLGVLPTR